MILAAEHGDTQVSRRRGKGSSANEHSSVPPDIRVTLTYQGEEVGQLVLGPRARGESWSKADLRLIDDLARHAGIAVHTVRLHTQALRLATELQQSRERLVAAREEERRRLRRDLHDGLGPALAGLGFKIDAAHKQLHVDAGATGALLLDLKGNLQEAIADIRRLYALRPPALDELGLIGALRLHIEGYRQSALQITLDAPADLPPLPAAIEVAVYRIISEALTNVGRHARAQRCHIRLALAGGLELEVRDDGQGLSESQRPGVGLRSMHERAEELGGTCVIEPAMGGGTRVWARLPLDA
jgi:signal transduction histidine kinase